MAMHMFHRQKCARASYGPAGSDEAAPNIEAATAQLVRGKRGKDLPATAAANPVEQDLLARGRRVIGTLVRQFGQKARQALDTIAQAKTDTAWVGVLREQFLARIDALTSRSSRRLREARADIEGVTTARKVIEIADEILIPVAATLKRSKRTAVLVFSGMVGGDATINGVVIWSFSSSVGGGLLGAWSLAIMMAIVIVGLGKALGWLAVKLRSRKLSPPALIGVGIGALLVIVTAAYFALAMGVARASGSLDIIHFLKIIQAPSEHLGALGLTIVSAGVFVAATLLSYRFANVNERYELVVKMERAMKEDRAADVDKAQDLLLVIPSVAAGAFEFYRQEQLTEQEQARSGVEFVEKHWDTLDEAVDKEAVQIETALRKHRRIVVGLCPDAPAYFREEPNVRSDVAALLAAAKESVSAIRTRLTKIEVATSAVDAAISAAIMDIQIAARAAMKTLDVAAYGHDPEIESSPTAIPPARGSLKLVRPEPEEEGHAPSPAE